MRHRDGSSVKSGSGTGTNDYEISQSSSADIIGLLIDREQSFSKTHRRIADAILTEPHLFAERPVDELTEWLQVSAPTITRFARAVGCEGLRDLKLKVMGSMRVGIRYLEPVTPPAALSEVAERVVNRAQRAISTMHQGFDLALADRIINAISDCRVLYAFGSGGVSSWLVEEIQNRFFRLGVRVVPCSDQQMQLMLASTMERGDMLLCCSLTGNNPELEHAISVAHEYGATTVALTRPLSPIADAVDLHFAINASDDGDVLGPTSIRYAYLLAIDLLAYGTAMKRQIPAREKLRRLKQQFVTFRDPDDTLPLCD